MKETGRTASSKAFTGKHESASATGRQKSATAKQQTPPAEKQSSVKAKKKNVFAVRKAPAAPAAQLSATARLRAVEQKKKKKQKRTLYIVFTTLAAAMIIVAAFILKGAAEQRSYNTYYGNALQSYYNGDYDSALANLRRASAITETEECSMLMVDCYEKQENYPKALELLEALYKKDKTNSVVSARIAAIKVKISEKKNESLVTVAGKQYEEWTSSLSLKDTSLGDGVLSDVVKLYSLTSLTLSGDSLTNISPLSALGGLVFLDLSNNSISDISPLGNLRELKTLYLDNNPITDLSPLYSLPQLEMLSIRGIAITDEQLDVLSETMPNCKIHSDPGTPEETASEVTVGSLSFRTDAEELDLSNMGLTDLSPLTVCKSLKKLNITGNSVSDLTPLMDLPELEWLSFKDNLVTDLRPLMGMRSLRCINAEGNGITGTMPLAALTDLSELYLAFNRIEDLSGLRGMTNLRRLGLENTGLTDADLDLLATLTGLDVLPPRQPRPDGRGGGSAPGHASRLRRPALRPRLPHRIRRRADPGERFGNQSLRSRHHGHQPRHQVQAARKARSQRQRDREHLYVPVPRRPPARAESREQPDLRRYGADVPRGPRISRRLGQHALLRLSDPAALQTEMAEADGQSARLRRDRKPPRRASRLRDHILNS